MIRLGWRRAATGEHESTGFRNRWPWPGAAWIAVAAIFLVAFVIQCLHTDAQGWPASPPVRLGGSITTLAPFWPEIKFSYSPAFFLLAAQPIWPGARRYPVLIALGHAGGGDGGRRVRGGREFGGERVGAAAIFAVLGMALFSTVMDSAYTNMLGISWQRPFWCCCSARSRADAINIALAAWPASLPVSRPIASFIC